jgi:hypothetical protein
MLANNLGDKREVNFLGQQLIQNQMAAQANLQSIGGPRSNSLSGTNLQTYTELSRQSGSAFDRQFMSALIQLLESTLTTIQNQSASGALGAHAADVSGWIRTTLVFARDLARLV